MVGVGTVIADDPMLTCRTENGRNPVRIICDTHLRIPEECNIVKTAKEIPTIIAVCDTEPKKAERLAGAGCEILTVGEADGHTDLRQLMKIAGERKIDSILIEGGGELNWSALQAGIVSKVQTYIAPKLFGGAGAKSPLSGQGVPSPDKAFMLTDSRVRQLGEDFLIESRVKNVHGNN